MHPKTCPYCGNVPLVRDCGYTTFNPGYSKCKTCKKEWDLGYVDTAEQAIRKWNKARPYIKRIDTAYAKLLQLQKKSGLRFY